MSKAKETKIKVTDTSVSGMGRPPQSFSSDPSPIVERGWVEKSKEYCCSPYATKFYMAVTLVAAVTGVVVGVLYHQGVLGGWHHHCGLNSNNDNNLLNDTELDATDYAMHNVTQVGEISTTLLSM